jgi:hypothetical protein
MNVVPVPASIDGARVLAYAIVDARATPTGATVHTVRGELMPPAAGLAIAQYDDDEGCYLFYCDAEWRCVTDTWHAHEEAAKRQAEHEYRGISSAWVTTPSGR